MSRDARPVILPRWLVEYLLGVVEAQPSAEPFDAAGAQAAVEVKRTLRRLLDASAQRRPGRAMNGVNPDPTGPRPDPPAPPPPVRRQIEEE